MSQSALRIVRLAAIGLLCLLIAFVLWRGARIGWLTWQGVQAAQQLRADSHINSGGGGQAGESVTWSEQLPRLRADLQLLSERLGALDAELQPLAPAASALQGLPGYGSAIAAGPQLVASAYRLVATAAAMGPDLDWLLGVDAPRTYLLIVQNNHELRATGGFISAFGTLVVEQASVADLSFVDSYELFSTEHEYPPAPQAMQEYMGIQLLVPRDANWSPDLPTAAETIRQLYTQETGQEVDGIITLDMDAVGNLVKALGSISVAGVKTPITAENLEQELVQLWEQPANQTAHPTEATGGAGDWWSQRKDFVPQVAGAALARLQAGDFDAAALTAEISAALDARSLQVWLAQPPLEQVLVERGWDGGLHPQAGADFLAVVDSNVGYNKVDAVMQRQLQYEVSWPAGASRPAEVTLTLTYTHPVAASEPGCNPAPHYGAAYADLIARCYFDYVRVYAPEGSLLLDVSGIDPETVTSTAGEQKTQQFAGYFVLPPASSKSITFTYQLPEAIRPAGYSLHIQRQAGTDPLPVHVVVGGMERTASIEEREWVWEAIP